MAIRTAVQNSRNTVLIHRDDGSIVVVTGEFLGSTSTTVTTKVSSNCGHVYDENGRLIQTIPLYNPPSSCSSSSSPPPASSVLSSTSSSQSAQTSEEETWAGCFLCVFIALVFILLLVLKNILNYVLVGVLLVVFICFSFLFSPGILVSCVLGIFIRSNTIIMWIVSILFSISLLIFLQLIIGKSKKAILYYFTISIFILFVCILISAIQHHNFITMATYKMFHIEFLSELAKNNASEFNNSNGTMNKSQLLSSLPTPSKLHTPILSAGQLYQTHVPLTLLVPSLENKKETVQIPPGGYFIFEKLIKSRMDNDYYYLVNCWDSYQKKINGVIPASEIENSIHLIAIIPKR